MGNKFEVGGKYSFRFIRDSDIKVTCSIVARTAKTITLKQQSVTNGNTNKILNDNKNVTRKIFLNDDGREFCYPLGKYSLCPILRAYKEV